MSQQLGSIQILPNEPYNMVLPSAGGIDGIPGDYLLNVWLNDTAGVWGIMRVSDTLVVVNSAIYQDGQLKVDGLVIDQEKTRAPINLQQLDADGNVVADLGVVEPAEDGRWSFSTAIDEEPSRVGASIDDGATKKTDDGYSTSADVINLR